MAASYIPATDSGFDDWGVNFSTRITAAPSTYGVTAANAVTIANARTAFTAALLAAVTPATRTPVTIAAKDAARISANGVYRTFASQIRINPGVLNSDKIALGLNLPNSAGSPVPPPTTFPLLTFVSAAPLTHQFSYKDSGTPLGKLKPYGVLQMQLYGSAALSAATDPAMLPLKEVETKSPFLVAWTAGDGGKIASYAARWVTRTGRVGPWSAIVTATVVSA